MFNTSTNTYELTDASGSYAWLWENMDYRDVLTMTDTQITEWVSGLADTMIEQEGYSLEEQSENGEYPRFGWTTSDVYEDAEAWLAARKAELESEVKADIPYAVKAIKAWTNEQAENAERDEVLNAVMTATEVVEEFGLAEPTVRQAINRESLPARKSGGTWLIWRKDAVARWGEVALFICRQLATGWRDGKQAEIQAG